MQEGQRAISSLPVYRSSHHSVQWLFCFAVRQGIYDSHDYGNYLLQIRYTLLWFITALFIAEQILFFLYSPDKAEKLKLFVADIRLFSNVVLRRLPLLDRG